MKPALFELSADTRFLRQTLHGLAPGGFVSYADLGAVIGRVVSGGTPALQSAMRNLLSEGYVFCAVRGEGIKRLTDGETVTAADRDIIGLRRRAKRAARKLSTVATDTLPPEKQITHTAKLSIIAAVSAITTDRAVTAVEGVAGGRAGELPIHETLKALGYVKQA